MNIMKIIGLFSVAGLSTVLLSIPALAGSTRSYTNPTYRGLPIDATPIEWNGQNEPQANEDAANLFCEWQGFDYAISWTIAKDSPIAQNGTYRFSEQGGTPQYCDFCRWHLPTIRCFKF